MAMCVEGTIFAPSAGMESIAVTLITPPRCLRAAHSARQHVVTETGAGSDMTGE